MAIKISIQSNADGYAKRLNEMAQRQIPFVASRTVTKVATLTRDEQLFQEYSKFFTVRNKPFFKTVHSVAASDHNFTRRSGYAVASIQPQDDPRPIGTTSPRGGRKANTQFMKRHVNGGAKTPKGGGSIAIPISARNIPRKSGGKGAGGIVAKALPKNIMASGKGFISGKKGRSTLFIKFGEDEKQAMYILRPSAQIKGGYNPLRAARRGVKKWFERTFRIQMTRAIRDTIARGKF